MISESQQECYAQLGKTKVQAAPQLFIDLDVEADGKAGYGSLLSIGAVSPWGESFYEELQPTCDLWVHSQRDFCEAHGLQRERLLRKGIPPAAAIAKLTDWQAGLRSKHQKTNSVIVAFNASFDYPMIDLEYLRAGLKSPFGVAGYCIKSLAMALSDNYDWRDTRKEQLPPDILPGGDFTHHALEDAIYQQQLHFALIGRLICEKAQASS